ncbi:MAG: hypothetical protein ACK50Q_02650 [Labrys sp. (in: a-proteobacteria)]|jgi:hypothetical protein
MTQSPDGTPRDPTDAATRLRGRNIALAIALAALVVLFYLVTVVKGPAGLNPGL